jgi:hypothetical protein
VIERMKAQNREWYVKVNNSALFKKIDLHDSIDATFYELGMNCLSKTVYIMEHSKRISMEMTINVLDKRV